MRTGSKLSVGVIIAGVLMALLLVATLLVGSCTAYLWNRIDDSAGSGAQRDALRARHATLTAQLHDAVASASDISDAASRLRSVALPPHVLGLAVTQADSDDNRVVLRRDYDGRQTSRVLINGAGNVTFEGRNGVRRTFDLLEVEATMQDGVAAEIELVLARGDVATGPE